MVLLTTASLFRLPLPAPRVRPSWSWLEVAALTRKYRSEVEPLESCSWPEKHKNIKSTFSRPFKSTFVMVPLYWKWPRRQQQPRKWPLFFERSKSRRASTWFTRLSTRFTHSPFSRARPWWWWASSWSRRPECAPCGPRRALPSTRRTLAPTAPFSTTPPWTSPPSGRRAGKKDMTRRQINVIRDGTTRQGANEISIHGWVWKMLIMYTHDLNVFVFVCLFVSVTSQSSSLSLGKSLNKIL